MSKYGIVADYDTMNDIKDKEINPFLIYLRVSRNVTIRRFKEAEPVRTEKITNFTEIIKLTNQNKDLEKVDLTIAKMKKKQISPFVFVYTDIKFDYKELSGIALRVLFYFIYEKLHRGCDFIITNPKDLSENIGISKSSSYDVFVELCNHKIIEKRNDSVWWINPNYFYTGNRLLITTK